MTSKEYIIKGFALQGLKLLPYQVKAEKVAIEGAKVAAYSAGVAVVEAKNIKPPSGNNYSTGVKKIPNNKFIGSVAEWAQLSILEGSYIVIDESNFPAIVPYDSIQFVACLITIQMAKNIVATTIQGRDGTVKEYISDGDYHINIKGVFTEANGVYPEDDIEVLKNICKAKSNLSVVSKWLQQFDITNIVIDNYSFPQREGFYNTQLFEINALSDQPVELFIK